MFEMNWSGMGNGDLLTMAEESFELFITTDQQLRYQQNLDERKLSILVLGTTSWPKIQTSLAEIVAVVEKMSPGDILKLFSNGPQRDCKIFLDRLALRAMLPASKARD